MCSRCNTESVLCTQGHLCVEGECNSDRYSIIERARDLPTPSSEIHGYDGYDNDEKYLSDSPSCSSNDYIPTVASQTFPPRPPNPIFNQRPAFYSFWANIVMPDSPASVKFTDLPPRSHRSRINRPRPRIVIPRRESKRSWRRTVTRFKVALILSIVIVSSFLVGFLGGLRIVDAEASVSITPEAWLDAHNLDAFGPPSRVASNVLCAPTALPAG